MLQKLKNLFNKSDTDIYQNETLYHRNGQVMYEGDVKGANFQIGRAHV